MFVFRIEHSVRVYPGRRRRLLGAVHLVFSAWTDPTISDMARFYDWMLVRVRALSFR